MLLLATLVGALALSGAHAQNCKNFGTPNGTACACPVGYGGPDCGTPACGGTLFQGSARSTVSLQGSNDFGNITAAGCSCEDGWTGAGCNVCQKASACSAGYASVSTASPGSVTGQDSGENNTMTCNSGATVYAAGQMSCSVNNPTLQATFPGPSFLNIMRTLDPSLTPIPNVTAFGESNTLFAQLIHRGVEQFACRATSCSQSSPSSGASTWTCDELECTCTHGATFCGGSTTLSIEGVINDLSGPLTVACDAPSSNGSAHCGFQQSTLNSLFGSSGLGLDGCTFGECVRQSVIDRTSNNSTQTDNGGNDLSAGVIAGLAVVGAFIGLALALLGWGCLAQRKARRGGAAAKLADRQGGVGVEWNNVEYIIPAAGGSSILKRRKKDDWSGDKSILQGVSGHVQPGTMMAILGPSGAGKTTLIEILAQKPKSGRVSGSVTYPSVASDRPRPRIGFVPQQDILSPTLTVREALLFAARLRLPESVPDLEKQARVDEVIDQLGLERVADTRIGGVDRRGISGGEARRVSIGLELVARPDILVLDEPTSGLDSVSASRVAQLLHAVAHDVDRPTAVIASIHQPSSKLYQLFDTITLLAYGHALYSGPGRSIPAEYFAAKGKSCPEGYNVADFLLEVASEAPVDMFVTGGQGDGTSASSELGRPRDKIIPGDQFEMSALEKGNGMGNGTAGTRQHARPLGARCEASFLTQLEVLSGREWKVLRRDKTLFFSHVAIAAVLGVFVGGLYYKTNETIAGFQSRVGCLFFLGALIAFSTLSALYSVIENRTLFVRERSNGYYSPAAWLTARLFFDLVPLRIIPTIIVSTITYWMAGLAHDAAAFFKFLLILVLYTLVMTLWNYLLGAFFRNSSLSILLSALSALYQMTYAGFFVHLNSIPPVLRWLQWICPLKYTLEALSVNEVGSGLMIQDTLEGVPVNVSAALIMQLLFGFGAHNYYRDVLVHVAFIVGFGVMVIGVVWLRVRERR